MVLIENSEYAQEIPQSQNETSPLFNRSRLVAFCKKGSIIVEFLGNIRFALLNTRFHLDKTIW